jgi:hypothetical protein
MIAAIIVIGYTSMWGFIFGKTISLKMALLFTFVCFYTSFQMCTIGGLIWPYSELTALILLLPVLLASGFCFASLYITALQGFGDFLNDLTNPNKRTP